MSRIGTNFIEAIEQERLEFNEATGQWQMTEQAMLIAEVQDKILEVANLFNEATTSDLQGIAWVEASKIVALVKERNTAH